jgi:hypothetical protein
MTLLQQLSSLRPDDRGFIDCVHISLDRTISRQSRPLKWSTLVQNYSAMYEMLNFRVATREMTEDNRAKRTNFLAN